MAVLVNGETIGQEPKSSWFWGLRLASLLGATFRSSLLLASLRRLPLVGSLGPSPLSAARSGLRATAPHRLLPLVVELRPKGLVVAVLACGQGRLRRPIGPIKWPTTEP